MNDQTADEILENYKNQFKDVKIDDDFIDSKFKFLDYCYIIHPDEDDQCATVKKAIVTSITKLFFIHSYRHAGEVHRGITIEYLVTYVSDNGRLTGDSYPEEGLEGQENILYATYEEALKACNEYNEEHKGGKKNA